MIIDYRDAACPDDFDTDLCIIGAGAAGIAIARSFIGSALRVLVVESGGMAGEECNQALYDGDSIGNPSFNPGTSRMRVFGGTCNLWGGGCIPLGQLPARDWVPHGGWPIGYDEMLPYYSAAREFCAIRMHDFDADAFKTAPAWPPLEFAAGEVVNKTFAFSPLLFGQAYRGALEDASNITVLLHANVLQAVADPSGGHVRCARIASLEGRRGTLHARHYVLACGGIENARLLLLSDAVDPRGLGNGHDLVGRYFMDHPSARLGTIRDGDLDRLTRPYDRDIDKTPESCFPEICLSDAAQREHRMLNARVRPFAIEGTPPPGIRALRALKSTLQARHADEASALQARLCVRHNGEPPAGVRAAAAGTQGIALQLLQVLLGSADIARAAWCKLRGRPTVPSDHVALVGYFEQAPNADSRVVLGTALDALGQRRVRVDWQLTALDRHSYRTATLLFGNALAAACNGRFVPERWLLGDDDVPAQVHGTSHHIGTTRMAEDPRDGVVDRNCKVHGIDNLHIAGSSVFPIGGWAFPTFTIVALALRLAAHLQGIVLLDVPLPMLLPLPLQMSGSSGAPLPGVIAADSAA